MSLADTEAKNAFNYNCTNWSEDSTVFILPNDIQFVDFSEMIKNFKP